MAYYHFSVSPEQFDRLSDRLRWAVAPETVPGSLPVLFFGDLPRAAVATIGINPSRQEYLSPGGIELDGAARRLETLASLGVQQRDALLTPHVNQAVRTMRAYFAPTKPAYHWFQPLARVMAGFGASFAKGEAAHLDLVQEATDPTWSRLHAADRHGAKALLDRDLPFLKWQIEAFPLRTLVCTSKMVLEHVLPMVDARIVKQGRMARLRWTVAVGRARDHDVTVVGWNIPLSRPTGLDVPGQVGLGELLQRELHAIRV